jgi:hypothetical protein
MFPILYHLHLKLALNKYEFTLPKNPAGILLKKLFNLHWYLTAVYGDFVLSIPWYGDGASPIAIFFVAGNEISRRQYGLQRFPGSTLDA